MSNQPRSEVIQLPVGRFVSGDLIQPQTKDHKNRPIDPDKQATSFGIAVPKDAPGMNEILTYIQQFAAQQFASVQPVAAAIAAWDFANFSWKFSDGDAPSKKKGTVNENTVGCWVFWFRRSVKIGPVECVQFNGTSNVPVDPALIKRGYYVDAAFKIQSNGINDLDGAGIYSNIDFLRFIKVGKVITGGPDADDVMSAPSADVVPMLGSEAPAAPAVGLPGAPAPAVGLPGAPVTTPPVAAGLPGAGVPSHDTFANGGAPAPVAAGLPTGLPGQ